LEEMRKSEIESRIVDPLVNKPSPVRFNLLEDVGRRFETSKVILANGK
jgi:hypothetical protein